MIIAAGLTNGTCRKVLMSVLNNHTPVISESIVKEYACVIQREKFSVYRSYLQELVISICQLGTLVKETNCNFSLPDKDDEKYLEAAQSSNAAILITGNKKHFPEDMYGTIRIMTPSDYSHQHIEE